MDSGVMKRDGSCRGKVTGCQPARADDYDDGDDWYTVEYEDGDCHYLTRPVVPICSP